ncbi:suppressor of RPS4-RLD 1 [Nymphaea colorata]|nr:suppressor of RPS4-RLD 1 [Nymphaea colorata]
MAASDSERQALVEACAARDWSKAIRILDSLISQFSSVLDICKRAYCYSQLELYKHVIKDCNRALELDPDCVQAYVLKGHAFSALGKQADALHIWEQGHGAAVRQSADTEQLLELEKLCKLKQNRPVMALEQPVQLSTSLTNHNSGAGIQSKSGNKAKLNQQSSSTAGSKTKSISLDFRLSRGIAQVNEGNYDQAVSIFNQILRENPMSPEALIGRGTAYAFQKDLDTAMGDFSKAIESNPMAGEAWKRRGQARAAMGEFLEAIEDLTKALEIEPNSSDILHERGIVNFKSKDYEAAVEDLSSCVVLDKDNKSAFTYLGLSLSSLGEYARAEEAHKKSLQLDPKFEDGWLHLAQFYQELGRPEKALACLERVIQFDSRVAKAYHLRGLLQHGMGNHRSAIKDLSLGLDIEGSNIECMYLRASCHHALGCYGDAVKDYDCVLDLELDSIDKFVLQCMAFYQKEMALYTASRANLPFASFDIDGDVDPLFKEYWCKRLHPKYVCERVYRQPPLRTSLKSGRLRPQDFTLTKHKKLLLQAADSIGKKIQYDCAGFLPNRRQYRMAGLAAIEVAQKVQKTWRSLHAEWKVSNKPSARGVRKIRRKEKPNILSQNRGGVGCSTTTSSETSTSYSTSEDRSTPGRYGLSWHEVYSLAVKWRQISEPCDPVVWVNKLSEEFNAGFGSHTPLINGQAKVARYYPYYQRALGVAKKIMEEKKFVNSASDSIIDLSDVGKLQSIVNADGCGDLHDVVGEDFWLATPCYSTAFEGKCLDGTRITTQKIGKKGYDFAIRTPCTPSRWEDYDAEMIMAWEALCNDYCGEAYGSTDLDSLKKIQQGILRLAYYWYNFMPLSRGTAVVGYVVLLGLHLAANMEVTENIPKGIQVDWEAILTPNLSSFIDSINSWLWPSIQINTSWRDYPDVLGAFTTTGSVIAGLSNYEE